MLVGFFLMFFSPTHYYLYAIGGVRTHLPLAVVQPSYTGVAVVARQDEADLGLRAGVLPDARLYRQLVVVLVGGQIVLQGRCAPLKENQNEYSQPIVHYCLPI